MLNALLAEIARYRNGEVSFDSFERWFEHNCNGLFGEEAAVKSLCLQVEQALSNYRFDHLSELELKHDLAIAARYFEAPLIATSLLADDPVRAGSNKR